MATFSVNDQARRAVATANGSNDSFSFSFQVNATTDVKVYVDGTLKTAGSHYDIVNSSAAAGLNTDGTGVAKFTSGNVPANNAIVTILSDVPVARTSVYTAGGNITATSLEADLDTLTMVVGDREERDGRALTAPVNDAADVDMTIPDKATRSGKALAFNSSTGNPEAIEQVTGASVSVSGLSAGASPTASVSVSSGTAAFSLGIPAGATGATGATGAAGAAATVEVGTVTTGSAGSSATVTNAGSSSAATFNFSIPRGDTGATGATGPQGPQGPAGSGSGDMNDLIDDTSPQLGGDLDVVTHDIVSTSNRNIDLLPNGSGKVNLDGNGSSGGVSISDGLVEMRSGTGSPAQIDMYCESSNAHKVSIKAPAHANYSGDVNFTLPPNHGTNGQVLQTDGSGNLSYRNVASGETSLILYEYTATAGQTTFSGSDDNSATLSYTADNLQVVMNGVILDPSDFTATNGTSVVLASGAALNDLVNIYAFKSFTTADMVSKTNGGTFAGAVGFTSGFTASDGCTITTADNDPQLTLVSTDADATQGPVLKFYRNSASPADNDLIGQLLFHGEDGAGNDQQYANIQSIITNNAHGNESSSLNISTIKGGSVEQSVKFGATETVFNESSLDLDFRVESLGDANSFVVEGATRGIGMGTADPTIDSSLAGVSLSVASRVLHIHDDNGAYLKLTDPATGSNRGAQFGLVGTTAILNNCEGGNFIFGTGNTEKARITDGGDVLIGCTALPSASVAGAGFFAANNAELKCSSGSETGSSTQIRFLNGNGEVGAIRTSGSATSFVTSSDYRLKEAVTPITNATDRLKQLNPVRFNFIADADTTVDGFLAHEVSDIVPEAISGEKDAMKDEQYEVTPAVFDDDGNEVTPAEMGTRSVPDYQGIDQSKLVPLLVATIQELEARIAALETAE